MENKLLINGFSAKAGGGKVIFDSILNSLPNTLEHYDEYHILCPFKYINNSLNHKNAIIVEIPNYFKYSVMLPFFYLFWVPRYVKKHNVNKVFNLGDLVFPFIKKQLYFFDWAYLLIPESKAWNKMSWKNYLSRKFKVFLIFKYLKNNSTVIVQSEAMKLRMEKLLIKLKVKECKVITLNTPIDFQVEPDVIDSNIDIFPNDFVYLATCGPHKNFEIIVPVIEELSKKEAEFRICLTLPENSNYLKSIKEQLEKKQLSKYFKNFGVLGRSEVYHVLRNAKGLFFPSLLESYGIPYLEAMHSDCTIITSDFDFTRAVCQESAFYFDPFSPESISLTISSVINNPEHCKEKIDKGKYIVNKLSNWEDFTENCILISKN